MRDAEVVTQSLWCSSSLHCRATMPSTLPWVSCPRHPCEGSTLNDEPLPEKPPPSFIPATPRVLCTLPVQLLFSCSQSGPCREMGTPLVMVPLVLVPGRKRALVAQVRAQLSFLPVLLQVRVARGGTDPGRHFSSSEGHMLAADDKQGCPWLAQPGDPQGTPAPSQVMERFTREERVPECGIGTTDQNPNLPSSSLRCEMELLRFWGSAFLQ